MIWIFEWTKFFTQNQLILIFVFASFILTEVEKS